MKLLLEDHSFNIVCNFSTFMQDQADQNIRLFKDKTKQFIFIFIRNAVVYDHEK